MDTTELDTVIAIWSLQVFHSSRSSGNEWSYVFLTRKNYDHCYTAYVEEVYPKPRTFSGCPDVSMFSNTYEKLYLQE